MDDSKIFAKISEMRSAKKNFFKQNDNDYNHIAKHAQIVEKEITINFDGASKT